MDEHVLFLRKLFVQIGLNGENNCSGKVITCFSEPDIVRPIRKGLSVWNPSVNFGYPVSLNRPTTNQRDKTCDTSAAAILVVYEIASTSLQ